MPILNLDDAAACAAYDDFVATHPAGHLLQLRAWSKLKSNWNAHFVYLTDSATHAITAAASVLSIRDRVGGSFFYAPRGPVGDVTDPTTVLALVHELQPVLDAENAFLLRLDPAVPYSPELQATWGAVPGVTLRSRGLDEHSFSQPRHEMHLSLAGRSGDEIIAGYKRKFRYQIRQTYKDGLSTQLVDGRAPEAAQVLQDFSRLNQQMAARKGITCRPLEYFQRFAAYLPDVRLYRVSGPDGQALGAGLVAASHGIAHYLYAASADTSLQLHPGWQLVTQAFTQAAELGDRVFDMGGVFALDFNDGLFKYKHKFCGDEGVREYLGELDFVLDPTLYQEYIARQ